MVEREKRRKRALETTFPFLAGALLLLVLLLFLEAVFQASKASYFSQLSIFQRFTIFFDSLLFVSIPIIMVWLLMYASSVVLYESQKSLRYLYYGYSFLLSLIFFIIMFSHLDTFFYSAFESDVYDLPLFVNLLLLFLLIDASLLLVIKKGKGISDFFLARKTAVSATIFIILIICSLFTVRKTYATWRETADLQKELVLNKNVEYRPNIILFAADSLDCRRLGVYGYVRNTTPNMSRLQNFVLYTRAYTNCGNSRGSIVSMLTGKSPATTKLTFPPDILHDKDAFQHLPNMLAKLGYLNVDLNDGYYASTSKSNLRDGFHMENGHRTGFSTGLSFWKKVRIAFSNERYLLADLYERHTNKIMYMVGRSSRLYNYARFMTWGEGSNLTDRDRIDMLNGAIRETNQPIFAHVHLMTTHGPLFSPPYRRFSVRGSRPDYPEQAAALEEQRRAYYLNKTVFNKHNIDEKTHWDLNDDATLSVDHYFGEVVRTLEETDKLKDTIIIFLTDHGMGMFSSSLDTIKYPLPLIVHLPGQEERITVQKPVQYLDIAPSILAYLNQPIPDWMEGNVVFGEPMTDIHVPERSLVAVYASDRKTITTLVGGFTPRFRAEKQDVGPPHFGIGLAGLIVDNKYYLYTMETNSGNLYDVSDDPFSFRMVDSPELTREYHEQLYEKLEARGVRIEHSAASRPNGHDREPENSMQ